MLWKSEEMLNYLREKRFLSDATIDEFNFGYVPSESNYPLAGRVIMPLYDEWGDLNVVTSRHFFVEKQYQHWHEGFVKKKYVYGAREAKKKLIESGKAIVVEGQFDVACLHSHGFKMTVGILGTTLSAVHIAKLIRYVSEIYLLFDPDTAGDKSIESAKELYREHYLDKYGVKFYYPKLPKGIDPDEFVHNYGNKEFLELLKESKYNV